MKQITLLKTLTIALFLLMGVGSAWGQVISQYVETNDGTTPKGIEIWNNTGATLDFATNNLIIRQGTNGGALSDLTGTLINTGTLASGDVLVIGTADIETYLTNAGLSGITFVSYGFAFNGDDALAVKYGATTTDVFGNPGNDPGTEWAGSGVSTKNQNIQLLSSITSGDIAGWTDPSTRFKTVSTTPALAGGLKGFGLPPTTSTFSGLGNWSDVARWNNGLPDANMNAVITGNANVDAASTIINITISDGGSLRDNGNLTINGTFTMQRTIANNNGWHLIAAPTTGMAIQGSDFVPAGSPLPTTFDFYAFDETQTTDVWVNIRQGDNTPNPVFANFVNGKGYLVAYSAAYSNTTFDFTGTINTGNISSPTLTHNASGQDGWNLIGNPYPSAIDWSNADKSQFVDVYAYIYNENKDGGAGYDPINGIIAPNQGFFVELRAANAGETFGFTDGIRADGGTFLKAQSANDLVKIRFGNQNYYDETTLKIHDEAAATRDRQDARKLYSFSPEVPQLFTLSADLVELSINALPGIEGIATIALGHTIPASGIYYIEIAEIEGMFAETALYLEDVKLGTQVDLSAVTRYDFEAELNEDSNRFLLHFGAVGIDENAGQNSIRAYTYNNTLYVQNSLQNATIRIIDLQGRLLSEKQLNGQGLQSLPLDFPAGVYVVQLVNSQTQKTIKVIVE